MGMNHDAASGVRRHGLFLDLDGTLADSLTAMRGVYDRFLQEFEATPSDEEFEELNGPPLAEIIKILKNRHGLTGSFDGLQEDYLAMVLDACKNLPPSEGAPEGGQRARLDHRCRDIVPSSQHMGLAAPQ